MRTNHRPTVNTARLTTLVQTLGRTLPAGWTAEMFVSCDRQHSVMVVDETGQASTSYVIALCDGAYQLTAMTEDAVVETLGGMGTSQTVEALTTRVRSHWTLPSQVA